MDKWNEIKSNFYHGLILGNGASIAFDQRFGYRSLKDRAQELGNISSDVQQVFEYLDTTDFELVLRMLWHTSKINQILEIVDSRTTEAYENVRDALIEIVHNFHVPRNEVSDHLETVATFMSGFSTVVSLNYDILVYWAIQVGNESSPNRIKDCFTAGGKFQKEWRRFREPYPPNTHSTLVFYPHGNLTLVADLHGNEFKIPAGEGIHLLDTVFQKWRANDSSPVFVSEGTPDQKLAAIRRSSYLSTVYNEVLPDMGESAVVFGWSMSDNDDHILDAICSGTTNRFAIAVNPASATLSEFKAKVRRKLNERLGSDRYTVKFFDRGSEGCWLSSQ